MKLRIISDGTCEGTQIENAETGEPLQNVYEVRFVVTAGKVPCLAEVVLIAPVTEAFLTAIMEQATPYSPLEALRMS